MTLPHTRAVTYEEIIAKRCGPGGWTKAQYAEWGIAWPPSKGWIERLTSGEHVHEPIACGEGCAVERLAVAATRAIMKAANVTEDQALELLALEYSAQAS